MAAPLNRIPRGLLDFFGIKSGGRNPQVLTEQLLPTYELNDWYNEAAATEFQASLPLIVANTNSGFSTFTGLDVPPDQVWIVRAGSRVTWDFGVAAGMSIDGIMVSRNVTAARFTVWPMDLFGFTTSDAAIVRSGGRVLKRDLFIHPGERPQFMNMGTLAAAAGVQVQVCVSTVRAKI